MSVVWSFEEQAERTVLAILANIRITTTSEDDAGERSTRSLALDTPRGEWRFEELQELARTTAEAAGMLTERTVRVVLEMAVPEPDDESPLPDFMRGEGIPYPVPQRNALVAARPLRRKGISLRRGLDHPPPP